MISWCVNTARVTRMRVFKTFTFLFELNKIKCMQLLNPNSHNNKKIEFFNSIDSHDELNLSILLTSAGMLNLMQWKFMGC